MKRRRLANPCLILTFLAAFCISSVGAQTVVGLSFDENGAGSITTGGSIFPTVGALAPDPGPGGLPLALTYSLLMPPSLVVGDVLILDVGGGLSDVIRFNPTGQLVFYSDNLGGVDALADTGFPTAFYTNNVRIAETTPLILYIPAVNQPGFVPGFATRYTFASDAQVPEPGILTLLGLGLLALGASRRRGGEARPAR